jgi:hypothetical protein
MNGKALWSMIKSAVKPTHSFEGPLNEALFQTSQEGVGISYVSIAFDHSTYTNYGCFSRFPILLGLLALFTT